VSGWDAGTAAPYASSYALAGQIQEELIGIGVTFTGIEATSGGKTAVDDGEGTPEVRQRGEGAEQQCPVGESNMCQRLFG
jgi:hypothetical protein